MHSKRQIRTVNVRSVAQVLAMLIAFIFVVGTMLQTVADHLPGPSSSPLKPHESATSKSVLPQSPLPAGANDVPPLTATSCRRELQQQQQRGGIIPREQVQHELQSEYPLTIVLMSYPKSSRFHLLEKIIRKCTTPPWSTSMVWEVILVWNGELSDLPPNIERLQSLLPSKKVVLDSLRSGGAEEESDKEKDTHRSRDQELLLGYRREKQKLASVATDRVAHSFFTILPQSSNRIDNRWRVAAHIDTDAVLNMDDDINLFFDGARCMLQVWQAAPTSLIAVDVRSHFAHSVEKGPGPFGPWGYVARDVHKGFKQYSIALPRALLTNRAYYHAYDASWQLTPDSDGGKSVKQIVDELYCDDIAFNFVAANTTIYQESKFALQSGAGGGGGVTSESRFTRGEVVYVKAHYEAYPESHSKDGLTKKEGMKAMRQRCVNELAEVVRRADDRGGEDAPDSGKMVLRHRPWHVMCSVDG